MSLSWRTTLHHSDKRAILHRVCGSPTAHAQHPMDGLANGTKENEQSSKTT